MTQQIINVGAFPNDGTGDPVRLAMQKSNANFTELYNGDVFLPIHNPHAYGILKVTSDTGSGNEFSFEPGPTLSNGVVMRALGSDNDVNLHFIPKGVGESNFYGGGALQAAIGGPAGATRYLVMGGSVAGNPFIAASGGNVTIDSLVMTGNPTAPTPAPGDSDTSVATTAWVQSEATGYAKLNANNTFTAQNFFTGTAFVYGHTAVIGAPSTAFQINNATPQIFSWLASAAANQISMSKSRGATPGVHVVVSDGDLLGGLVYNGSDGSAFAQAANIQAFVDGAPAAGQVPGKMVFNTRPAGGGSVLQRMLIDSFGRVVCGPAATGTMGSALNVSGVTSAAASITVENYQNTINGATLVLRHSRGATVGTLTPVQSGDALGNVTFQGSDSASTISAQGAAISVVAELAPSTGHIPAGFQFWTDDNTDFVERVRLDRLGRITVHYGAGVSTTATGGFNAVGINGNQAGMTLENYQAAAGGALVTLRHSRGTTVGTQAALIANDPIGVFQVAGSDGSAFVTCGGINFVCDAAPTAGRVSTRIGFLTDNGISYGERVRICSSGGIAVDTTIPDPGQNHIASRVFDLRQNNDTGLHAYNLFNIGATSVCSLYVNPAKHLQLYSASATCGTQISVNGDLANPVANFFSTGVAIKGSNDNSDAAVGFVGEYFDATSGSVALTANVQTNLCSISNVPAGDYDVEAHANVGGPPVAANFEFGASTTSATLSGAIRSYTVFGMGAGVNGFIALTRYRLKLASTSTVYLVARSGQAHNVNASVITMRRVR